MVANPQVAQGTLNRVRGSITIPNFPALNVTAPYLGKAGISLGFEGQAVTQIPTATGVVNSPEPYQITTATVNLLKTQNLAALYEAQRQKQSVIGDMTIVPDASTLPAYNLTNCSIENVRELSFSGDDAGYVVTIKGYQIINNDMWNLI